MQTDRLHKGDLCMLSASCVLDAVTFDVFVDAEEDSQCCVVSGPAFAAVSERNPDLCIGNCGQPLFRCDVGDAACR